MPKDKDLTDYDLNDVIIYDLARHIEEGGKLDSHYLHSAQSDLFEYEEKLEVDSSKIGIDIIERISNNSGKQE